MFTEINNAFIIRIKIYYRITQFSFRYISFFWHSAIRA